MHNSTLARHGWPARVFARHVWRSLRRGHKKPRPRHFAVTRHVALLVGAAIKVRIDVEVAGMPTLGIRLPPTTLIAHRKSRPVARAAAALCMNDEITRRFITMRVHPGDVVILI
jgi:hypothetical protein